MMGAVSCQQRGVDVLIVLHSCISVTLRKHAITSFNHSNTVYIIYLRVIWTRGVVFSSLSLCVCERESLVLSLSSCRGKEISHGTKVVYVEWVGLERGYMTTCISHCVMCVCSSTLNEWCSWSSNFNSDFLWSNGLIYISRCYRLHDNHELEANYIVS